MFHDIWCAMSVSPSQVKSGILLSSVQHMVSRSLREYVEGMKQKRHPSRSVEEGKPHEPVPFPSTSSLSYDPYYGDSETASVTRFPLQETIPEEPKVPVKSEDSPVERNEEHQPGPPQGQDMTGQGAITTTAVEREKKLTLNTKDAHEPKVPELASPTQGNAQLGTLDHHQSSSSIHQITASTGQAVPHLPASKNIELKTQNSTTVTENRSYALATKRGMEPSTSDIVKMNVPSIPFQTTLTPVAERVCSDHDVTRPTSRLNSIIQPHDPQLEVPGELAPVRQAHSDTEASSVERDESVSSDTLKRKALRSKPKIIKLTFIEFIKETKVIQCELLTSNGKILKYQFSLKYDKPEEMFLKFVTAGHLTEQDKDEFLHQSEQVIQKVKGTSSTREYKMDHSDPKLPSLGILDSGKHPTGAASSTPMETPAMTDPQRPPGKESLERMAHPTDGKDASRQTVVSRASGLSEIQRSEPVAKMALPDPGPIKDSAPGTGVPHSTVDQVGVSTSVCVSQCVHFDSKLM